MGVFSKIKEFFNKNIECGVELDNHIVYFLKKKKYLYINKNIIVREGSNCVVVYKGRILDVILPGKYKINEECIPETFSRAKIEKLNKKGHKVKRIRVGLYFVNTTEFKNFEFSSNKCFRVKSTDLGKIKGFLSGTSTIRVIDSGALIKALISKTGKIKSKEILNNIAVWVGNKINKTIEKNKIPTSVVLCNQNQVESILNTDLEDGYDKLGLFVCNIKLKAIDFPKKFQPKVNEYLAKHKRIVGAQNIKSNMLVSVNRGGNRGDLNNYMNNLNINNTMQNNQKNNDLDFFKMCRRCGKKNNLNDNFCKNCGIKLN